MKLAKQQIACLRNNQSRNGTIRRGRFGDGRFCDEMWNVFSFGMSPKCTSSHCLPSWSV